LKLLLAPSSGKRVDPHPESKNHNDCVTSPLWQMTRYEPSRHGSRLNQPGLVM
jgi:hypothetical protein